MFVIRSLKNISNLPWLVCGDFNQILFEEEKKVGPPKRQQDMVDFHDALDKCRLKELGYIGEPFTWWKGQS